MAARNAQQTFAFQVKHLLSDMWFRNPQIEKFILRVFYLVIVKKK